VHIHKYVRVRGNNWRHCASPRYADIYIHTCHTSTGRVSCHISVYAPRIGGRESEPALPPPPPPPPLICMHFSNITVPLSYSLSCVCIYICANRVFQRDFSAHFFKFPDFSRDFSLFPRFSRSFEKTTVRQLPFANSATHWRGPHRHHNICIYKYIYIYWFLLCFRVSCLLRKHGADGQTELMFTSISYLVMQRLTFLSFCFSFLHDMLFDESWKITEILLVGMDGAAVGWTKKRSQAATQKGEWVVWSGLADEDGTFVTRLCIWDKCDFLREMKCISGPDPFFL